MTPEPTTRARAPRRPAPAPSALAALAALVLLLAACAPAPVGTSAFRPAPLPAASSEVRLEPGSEAFFLIEYPYSEFDVGVGDFAGGVWVPEGASSESTDAASDFALRDLDAPAGWNVELARVRAVRGTGGGSSDDGLEVVLAVRVPVNAPIGRYRIEARLRHDAGADAPISFRVRVP